MRDIQNERDTRDIPLQKVGVRGLHYPVRVLDKDHKTQNTTATADLFVNLPHHFKGTHMSRFVEIFHAYHTDLSMKHFLEMLQEIRQKLDAEEAFGTLSFPFFLCRDPCRANSFFSTYSTFFHHTKIRNFISKKHTIKVTLRGFRLE